MNVEGVKNISLVCKKCDIILFYVLIDYVFDGKKLIFYEEIDEINFINVYGVFKLKGEEYIKDICDKYFIIRVFWLYL